jgi:hypothetical protein
VKVHFLATKFITDLACGLIGASAPYGDFNRLVAGQWKSKTDDSPFLAQRFTGGFFHITLDVDADPSSKKGV